MRYSIKEALDYAFKTLCVRERARLEAEILLSFVLGVDRVFLHANPFKMLSQGEFEEFQRLVLRAQAHEPIEYLTGKVGFYGYEWEISKGVLIPRPETEILVECAGEIIRRHGVRRVFEFGVGSGVISIMLALLHPQIIIQASDINPLAIELTQKNIERFSSFDSSLSGRIDLVCVDILKEGLFSQDYDLLVSNPPYISSSFQLPLNVEYEPKNALFGGERGDEILCALIDLAREYRIPYMACEMGSLQRESMLEKLEGCKEVNFYRDLSGLDRGFSVEL